MTLAEATSTIESVLTPAKDQVIGLIQYFFNSWFGLVLGCIFIVAIIGILIWLFTRVIHAGKK